MNLKRLLHARITIANETPIEFGQSTLGAHLTKIVKWIMESNLHADEAPRFSIEFSGRRFSDKLAESSELSIDDLLNLQDRIGEVEDRTGCPVDPHTIQEWRQEDGFEIAEQRARDGNSIRMFHAQCSEAQWKYLCWLCTRQS